MPLKFFIPLPKFYSMSLNYFFFYFNMVCSLSLFGKFFIQHSYSIEVLFETQKVIGKEKNYKKNDFFFTFGFTLETIKEN